MSTLNEIHRRPPVLTAQSLREDYNGESKIVYISPNDILSDRGQKKDAARLPRGNSTFYADQAGGLPPIKVRKAMIPSKNGGEEPSVIFELVEGERRLRAARLAGLASVPCTVVNEALCEDERHLLERILYGEGTMFSQAKLLQELIVRFGLTQEGAARRLSVSQSAIANKLRLLKLTPDEQRQILEANLTERHARALLKVEDPAYRGHILTQVIDSQMNVSTTESYIEQMLSGINSISPARSDKPGQAVKKAAEGSSVESDRHIRFKAGMQSLQLFYNSVQNAINMLKTMGLHGQMCRRETERGVVVTILIRKIEDEL